MKNRGLPYNVNEVTGWRRNNYNRHKEDYTGFYSRDGVKWGPYNQSLFSPFKVITRAFLTIRCSYCYKKLSTGDAIVGERRNRTRWANGVPGKDKVSWVVCYDCRNRIK